MPVREGAVAPQPPIPRRALILLVALTFVWGTNWPLFPYAVREISVWTFRGISMPVAGAAILAVAALRGQSLRVPRACWPTIVLATLCYLVVWNVASTYAAVLIPSGQASLLGFTMPLWSALISWAVLGERLHGRMVAALALGGSGVLLLMLPGLSAYAAAPWGFALGLASGIGWAVGTLILKRSKVPVQAQVPVLVLTGWQLIVGAVPVATVAWLVGDHQWFLPSPVSLAVLAYITLVPMCIGNICWFAIVGLLPTQIAGLSVVTVPVVAMISGALVHGEPLGPIQLAAVAACVTGVALALAQKNK